MKSTSRSKQTLSSSRVSAFPQGFACGLGLVSAFRFRLFCNAVANSGSIRSSNLGCNPTLNKETAVVVVFCLPVVPALFPGTGTGIQVNLDRLILASVRG